MLPGLMAKPPGTPDSLVALIVAILIDLGFVFSKASPSQQRNYLKWKL
jgi:hypothetical protein